MQGGFLFLPFSPTFGVGGMAVTALFGGKKDLGVQKDSLIGRSILLPKY